MVIKFQGTIITFSQNLEFEKKKQTNLYCILSCIILLMLKKNKNKKKNKKKLKKNLKKVSFFKYMYLMFTLMYVN